MKRIHISFLFCSLALLGITLFSLCSCNTRINRGEITDGVTSVYCDESFKNILEQEINVFEFTYQNASLIPYYVDESTAIDSLLAYKTKIIITAHKLKPEFEELLKVKKGYCRTQQIAVDAIALIINNDNPIDILSVGELKMILTGQIKEWQQIEPVKGLGDIKVVFDHKGSSTVKYMRDSLTCGKDFPDNVFAQGSSEAVIDAVMHNKNAIGIIGVSWISSDMTVKGMSREERMQNLNTENVTTTEFTSDVKVMKVRRDDSYQAFKPYQAYIYDGSYPLYRSIYAISTAPVGTLPQSFYCFITGVIGQKIMLQTGVMPSIMHPRIVEVSQH